MNKKSPKIRFKGFTDDWEQRKLEQLAQFNPKSSLPDKFEYVDLESVVGTEMISHRTETKENAPSRAQRLATQGDVFYQTVRPYQKNNYLFDLPHNNYVFSTGYAQLRPFGDSYFLLSRLQDDIFIFNVLQRSTGTSYPAINSSDLSQIEVGVPLVVEEQIKIGVFFKNLDHIIALHQDAIQRQQYLKKALLQKLFPVNGERIPTVRFTTFKEEWEQRKLGDVVKINGRIGFRGYTQQDIISKEAGGILTFSPTNIINNQLSTDVKNTYITVDKYEESLEIQIDNGDILFVKTGSTLGKSALVSNIKEKATINPQVVVLRTPDVLQKIVSVILTSSQSQKQISEVKIGGAVPTLTETEIRKIIINLPQNEVEQEKIGRFFQSIDDTIALHQDAIHKLQLLKQSLLQKMFV